MSEPVEPGHRANREALAARARSVRRLHRLRPTILAAPALKLLQSRAIAEFEGLRLFLDPTSHLGQSLLVDGAYEPETVALFRDHVAPGDTVFDIGANEGFFAALAARLSGPEGRVVAVEPQARLADVLEINTALNRGAPTDIVAAVIGEEDGADAEINLFPISNTGATSLVARYRFGAVRQKTVVRTPAAIMAELGIERFAFVKIDVEGYEPEVVRSLAPVLARGAVGKLLVDYHAAVLASRGLDAADTHSEILAHGYKLVEGDVGRGYVLYRSG